MSGKNINLIFRLLNIWFAFTILLFLSTYLPHWADIPFLTWLNIALYFFLFLMAVSISFKEKHNKAIFINLSIYLFAYWFGNINLFMGVESTFGTENLLYYFFHFKNSAHSIFMNLFIVFVVLKYLFREQKTWVLYMVSIVLILSSYILNFHPYLVKPGLFWDLELLYYPDLFRRMFLNNLLGLAFMIFYGYRLYKKDAILGEYINLLMACFFISLITNMTNYLSFSYDIEIFNLKMYLLSGKLVFMSVILFKKLCFINSEFGQFYESLVSKKIKIDKIQIKRYRSESNAFLLKLVKIYISQRRFYLITLAVVAGIGIGYFNFPKYFTILIITVLFCLIVLFWFVNRLYKRRAKQQYIIS
jgi:hypothetical protein